MSPLFICDIFGSKTPSVLITFSSDSLLGNYSSFCVLYMAAVSIFTLGYHICSLANGY